MGHVQLFFITLLFCLSRSKAKDFEELAPLKNALQEYIKTGHATDSVRSVFNNHSYPHLFRKDMKNVYDNPQICYLCNLVVDLVILERNAGMSRDTLLEEVVYICTEMNIENERVCSGAIELNVDTVIYIIDNYPSLASDRVCGSVLQSSGCDPGDNFEWTVEIAAGNSPERPKPNDTESETFTILQMSDIHYDPDYTPDGNANCGEPICCQSDQGEAATEEDKCGYWSDYRNGDSPWQLIVETIRQAKTQELDYVYYNGDIISHRVWSTSIEKNQNDINKLLSYFKEQFEVPVFPVFGNHEPSPLNVWPIEEVADSFSVKWLFELAAQQWSDLIGQDVTETVLKGGYYSVSPRPGFRVIGINSNLGSTENWWVLYNDTDPFNQLQWLADTLKEAEDNNESVHILSHIPSGTPLKVWSREYNRIIQRFANTITGHFNGDTHKDEFHVFYNSSDESQAINVAYNGASVTPFGTHNPSFKYYFVDETTFHLMDYEEWYFNLTAANSMGEADSLEWSKLYSFVEAYGAANLLPEEVDKVLIKMTEDHTLLDEYFRFKNRDLDASISGGCDDSCKKGLLCNIVTTLLDANQQCERFLAMYDQNL